MSEKKNTLPSLRNQSWKLAKVETEKISALSIHISSKNITELYGLINAGAKLVGEK